jgi:cytochrome c-type biogenesis protein CcmH
MDPFLASARTRLLQLKAQHDAGKLGAAKYESERRSIEREMADRLIDAREEQPRPSRRLVGVLAVAVLAVAAAGYWKTGSPSLVRGGAAETEASSGTAAAAPDSDASSPSAAAMHEQVAVMVDKLAARLKEHPDDAQGWIMLGRSYSVLGRFDDAIPAYRRASELLPNNAIILADWADAVAAAKGGANNPESIALIERALAADPMLPKALALAGTVAYDRGDFAGAVVHWQRIADQLPPDSEFMKQVQASIAEARERAGGAPAPATAPATRSATATAGAAASAAAPGGAVAASPSISGTVTLAPELAAKAARDDTVFVFARAAGGGRMPLAVKRAKVADLPLSFTLDDSMAMTPTATISGAKQVIVGARISKSGTAIPQAGDLSGEAAPVAPGATGLAIRIDSVVGAR